MISKKPPHIYEGDCPDEGQPDAFDNECARCQVDRMGAEIERLRTEVRNLRNRLMQRHLLEERRAIDALRRSDGTIPSDARPGALR